MPMSKVTLQFVRVEGESLEIEASNELHSAIVYMSRKYDKNYDKIINHYGALRIMTRITTQTCMSYNSNSRHDK